MTAAVLSNPTEAPGTTAKARCEWPLLDPDIDFDRAVIKATARLPQVLAEQGWEAAGEPTGWRLEERAGDDDEPCLYVVCEVPVAVMAAPLAEPAERHASVTPIRPGAASQTTGTDGYTGQQVCGMAGISYRQLDYWTRTGRVHAIGQDTPGSGQARRYSPTEAAIAGLINRLLDAGLVLPVACGTARRAVETGQPVEIAGGLVRIDLAAAVTS